MAYEVLRPGERRWLRRVACLMMPVGATPTREANLAASLGVPAHPGGDQYAVGNFRADPGHVTEHRPAGTKEFMEPGARGGIFAEGE
jgi:hypothetical protein